MNPNVPNPMSNSTIFGGNWQQDALAAGYGSQQLSNTPTRVMAVEPAAGPRARRHKMLNRTGKEPESRQLPTELSLAASPANRMLCQRSGW
jgi:hypothetical protein